MKNYPVILVLWLLLNSGKKVFSFYVLCIFIFCLVTGFWISDYIIRPACRFFYDLVPALLAGETVAFVILAFLAYVIWIAVKSRSALRIVAKWARRMIGVNY